MGAVHWNVSVATETDQELRVFLASRGQNLKGDQSRFIEDAVQAMKHNELSQESGLVRDGHDELFMKVFGKTGNARDFVQLTHGGICHVGQCSRSKNQLFQTAGSGPRRTGDYPGQGGKTLRTVDDLASRCCTAQAWTIAR